MPVTSSVRFIYSICSHQRGRCGGVVYTTWRSFHDKIPKTWLSWEELNGKGNIILMGSPGSGKTTTGQIVAQALGKSVVDMDDHVLTPVWGMSVADKLKQIGEKRFMEEEGRALLDLNVENTVISLSGSNPLHIDSMAHVAKTGLLVYLDATTETILRRQEMMKVDRIIGMESGASLEEVVEYRRQFYERWYDIRVMVHATDTQEVVAHKVLEAVKDFEDDPGYVSTRGKNQANSVRFLDTVLKGLAPDGGLYVKPTKRPKLSLDDIIRLVNLDLRERALRLLEKWIHPLDICPQELRSFLQKSYTEGLFEHPKMAPIIHMGGNLYTQELFHGPTASFKDWALQLMPRFFTKALREAGPDVSYLILTATSGDTGSAVLDGFGRHAGGAKVGVIVLYPEHNISEIQKRQTTTMDGSNIKVIGVDGDFDFCQQTVKQIFGDRKMKETLGACQLSAANSINWGRLLPQTLYHASSYLDLVKDGYITAGDPVDICVPTGNFGNILSAYYVKEMGFPIRRLICASNSNNILTDFMHTGKYSPSSYSLQKTVSPSIDIIKSSNLERLLYHLSGEDPGFVCNFYQSVAKTGKAQISKSMVDDLKETFVAAFATEKDTSDELVDVFNKTGYLMDPHTAVGHYVATRHGDPHIPTVISGTAHYGKFVDNVLPMLNPQGDHSSLSVAQLMDKAVSLTSTPGMNKLLSAMVSKPIKHQETVAADYDRICEKVRDFARTL